MEFTPVHIKRCLGMAQALREIYQHSHYSPSHTHISVNALLKIVQTNYKKNVSLCFHEDSHKDHYLYSFLHIDNSENYQICLMSGMSNCWNRFALCKELFHVILDEEKIRNTSLAEHLQDFRASIRDANIGGGESSKIEILTEFAAMQFLFPFSQRIIVSKEIKDRLDAGENKISVLKDISEKWRIPRLMVEDYLDAELMEYFDALSWDGKSS